MSNTDNPSTRESGQEKEHNAPSRIPTTHKLATALEAAGASPLMVKRAWAGYYDEYKSDLPNPIMALVHDAHTNRLPVIVRRAKNGEFDAQDFEAAEWAASDEGKATFAALVHEGRARQADRKRGTGRRSSHE